MSQPRRSHPSAAPFMAASQTLGANSLPHCTVSPHERRERRPQSPRMHSICPVRQHPREHSAPTVFPSTVHGSVTKGRLTRSLSQRGTRSFPQPRAAQCSTQLSLAPCTVPWTLPLRLSEGFPVGNVRKLTRKERTS